VSQILAHTEELNAMHETTPLTLSVPEAGRRYFGLSRVSAYAAATRGEIPTVRIGRLLRVPVRALEHMLDKATESRGPRPKEAASAKNPESVFRRE